MASGVYLAMGNVVPNLGMIVGEDRVIIIDATKSTKAAEITLAEFRKIIAKREVTILYTHAYRDHISGATNFSPELF